MGHQLWFALFPALVVAQLFGQQANSVLAHEHVKVYSTEPGVKAPQLISRNFQLNSNDSCEKKMDGKVELSLLVDTEGNPRNIVFIHPLGTDTDVLALRIASEDRFKSGTMDGKPVVVATSLIMKIQSCLYSQKDSAGKTAYIFRFRSVPQQEMSTPVDPPAEAILAPDNLIQNDAYPDEGDLHSSGKAHRDTSAISGSVSPPILLKTSRASYTEEARRARITGKCVVEFIVDQHGMPHNLKVIRSLDPGLDIKSLIAVSAFRFKPAMRDGEPIPVHVRVDVNFSLR